MLKSGYEADLKLLQATLEEERLRSNTIEHSEKNSGKELVQAKKTIEELTQKVNMLELLKEEVAALNLEVNGLKEERDKITGEAAQVAELEKKIQEL